MCAGGDVRRVVSLARDPSRALEACQFFTTEYECDWALAGMRATQVALMDGIVMGGGVGLCAHGRARVATERTRWAMPEVKIGLFPDVGASWFLTRLGGEVGTYLGLTGRAINGRDARDLGLATHLVPSARVPGLVEALLRGPGAQAVAVCDAAEEAGRGELGGGAGAGSLPPRGDLGAAFAGDSVRAILARLSERAGAGCAWSREALDAMLAASPLAVHLTLRMLREAEGIPTLRECLAMEWRLACQCLLQEGTDFVEGVEAALVRKDGRPAWRHEWPARWRETGRVDPPGEGGEGIPPGEAVPRAAVDAFFAPLSVELPWPRFARDGRSGKSRM